MQIVKFILAIPFGLLFFCAYSLMRATVRIDPLPANTIVPANAILFFSHTQIYGMALSPFLKKRGAAEAFVLGYHGFLPYVWVILDHLIGLQYFLFDPASKLKPSEQVQGFLIHHPTKRFALATDSGGPYGRVRPSLLKLSLANERPLVAMGAMFSRSIKIHQHEIPLPGARLTFRLMDPITPQELRSQTTEASLQKLQSVLDHVLSPPS